MANKKTSSKTTIVESTNDGKKGGLLDGKRHYDKDGKPLGGIKAIVTDTGQIVELEGGEVIINREASKLHWRELSRINQSAGDGVPILPPDVVNDDTEEYKNGGNTFDFNPNKIPTKWVYEYAVKIKENYPKVWNLAEDKYSNEAFKNLSNVYKRGSWLDGEEWFYYKWRVYPQKQKNTKTLVGVLNSLKWCNITKEGWRYMKNTIEKAIKKHYPKKYMEGGKFPILTEKSKQKLAPTFIDEKLPKNKGVGSVIERTQGMTLYTPFQINEILIRVGLPLRVIKDIGMGLYGNAFTTDRDSVLKVSYSSKEAYASFMIMQGDYESQVKVFNVFKITNADDESLYFIEKEYVKVAEKILEGLREPFDEYFKELYKLDDYKLNDKLGEKIKDEDLRNYAKTFYDNFETRNSIATNLVSKKLAFEKFSKEGGLDQKNLAYLETEIDSYRDFIQNKEQIVDETYRYLVFLNQIAIDKEYIDIDDYHTGNFGKIGDKYVCFDCSHSSFRAFLNGGNITNTYAYVEATTDKGRKVYKYFDHEPTHQEVYDYFKKIKDENGEPINIVDATINVEKLTDFNSELFLNHADKVVREKYGVGIEGKDETIISFDAHSFNVNEFEAELENGKLVTIGSVDGVVIIQEKYETGGQMQGEPPANFENVLWNNLVSRYKQGGVMGDIFSIEDPKLFKQILTIYNDFTDKFGIDNYFIDHNDNSVVFLRKTNFSGTEIANMEKKVLGLRDNFDVLGNKKPNAWGNNFKFYLNSDIKYKNGGGVDSELAKGIETEKEHLGTIKKIYDHKVPLNKAPELIAKDHIEENPKYYTKLAKMEQKFSGGGNISVGDEVTFLMRGATEPTDAVVVKKGTCKKSGKCTAVVKFKDTGRQLEVYETRLTKVVTDIQESQKHRHYEVGMWYYYTPQMETLTTDLLKNLHNDSEVYLYRVDRIQYETDFFRIIYRDRIRIKGKYQASFQNNASGVVLGDTFLYEGKELKKAEEQEISLVFRMYADVNSLYEIGDAIDNTNIGGSYDNAELKVNYLNFSYNNIDGALSIYGADTSYKFYESEEEQRWARIVAIQTETEYKVGRWYSFIEEISKWQVIVRVDKVDKFPAEYDITFKERIVIDRQINQYEFTNGDGRSAFGTLGFEDGVLMTAQEIEEAYRLLMQKYRWYEDGDTIDNETANGVEAVVLPSDAKTFRFKFDEGDGSVIGFDIIENPNDNTPTFIYDSDTDNKFAVKYLEQKANVGKYYLWCEDYSKPIDEYSRFFFGKLTKIEGTYHLSDYVDHNFLIPSVIELKLDEDETEQWRELDQKDALWQSIYWDRLTEIFKEVISRRYSIGDVINNNNIGFNTRSYTIQPMFVDKIMLDYLVLDELTDTIAGFLEYGYVGVMRLSAEQKFAEITNRQVEGVVLEPYKWYYTENILGGKIVDTLFQFRKKEKADIGEYEDYYCYNKLSVHFGSYVSYNGTNERETIFNNEEMVKNIQPATEDKILEQFVKYFEKKNLFNIGDVINNINILEGKTNAVIDSDEFDIVQLNSKYAYSISAFGKLDEKIEVYFSGYIKDNDTISWSGFAKIVGKQENKPTTTQENILLPSQEKFFDFQEGSDLNFVQQTLVRTKMFKDWFGDWELCKLLVVEQQDTIGVQDAIRIYRGVSKAINYNTLEPLVVYHGTKANEEFFIFEANRNDVGRPYSYFSQNIQYAQNFTRFSQRGSGNKSLLYQCFLSIKNPFNARSYGKAEVDRFMDAQTLIDFVADRLYRHHKIGLSLNSIKDVVNSQVGGYIRGVCNTNGDSLGRIPFWMLMAKDSKSTFKYFLISHKFDSIMYEEETSLNLSSADYDDPSKFTIAYAIFDSQQVKLADGRNITFDALNPDIRFEDGGNVTQTLKAEETEQYVSKKENIGNLLKGNQFKYEVGGNTAKMPKTENEMFVESLINKMK